MTSILLIAERGENGEIGQSTLQAITAASGLGDPRVTVVVAGEAPASANSLPVDRVVAITAIDPGDDGIFDRVTADLFGCGGRRRRRTNKCARKQGAE